MSSIFIYTRYLWKLTKKMVRKVCWNNDHGNIVNLNNIGDGITSTDQCK